MSSKIPRIKALVLTWDPNRPIARHMILQYEKLWPSHPFVFHIPYQRDPDRDDERTRYIESPTNIKLTVMRLLRDLDDEEWVYWCMDDRYPVRLVLDKVTRMVSHALQSPRMSGLLFCRCRALLKKPKLTLYRREWVDPWGDVYLERRQWYQIWIHQLIRVKVLRYLFSRFPEQVATGTKVPNAMDKLKHHIPKPRDYRLFVTKSNLAVFGESIRGGIITQNCYDSIVKTDIPLPDRFQNTNGEEVWLGTL